MNSQSSYMQNFLLIGSPGSGKGTLCKMMKNYGYHIIALGELLRLEVKKQSELGKNIEKNINQGILIPDQLAISIITRELSSLQIEQKPFVFEGFPSTILQFHLFLDYLKDMKLLSKITLITLECSEEIAIERIINRLTCCDCEAIYNLSFYSSPEKACCDTCNGPLYQRKEDTLDCSRRRIETYNEKTRPIIDLAKEQFPWVNFNTEIIH